jgi:hypothetical protein
VSPAAQTIAWLERYDRETKVQPYYAVGPSARAGDCSRATKSS